MFYGPKYAFEKCGFFPILSLKQRLNYILRKIAAKCIYFNLSIKENQPIF